MMSYHAVPGRLINSWFRYSLRTSPSYMHIPQHQNDDATVDEFSEQLQVVIDEIPKKGILVAQGDWKAKVSEDLNSNWKDSCDKHCNISNERGQRLLTFAKYSNFLVANILGTHKTLRFSVM